MSDLSTLDPSTTTLEPSELAERLAAEAPEAPDAGDAGDAMAAADGVSITVSLSNNDGYIQLNWNNTGAIGRWDYVALYETYPTDPNGYLTRQWKYVTSPSGSYVTGTRARGVAGPQYWIAYIGWDYARKAYEIEQRGGPSQP